MGRAALGLLAAAMLAACASTGTSTTDGFDRQMVASMTEGDGMGMSDVESRLGAAGVTTEIARSENGCVEAWIYNEPIMDGLSVKAIEMLTVYFDEDGLVCSTHLTDGDKLDESRDRP